MMAPGEGQKIALEEATEEGRAKAMELEPEFRRRRFTGPLAILAAVIAIAMALFHLYTAWAGVLPELQQRGIHLAFALTLIFLLFPFRRQSPRHRLPLWDGLLAALGAVVGAYVAIDYYQIHFRIGTPNLVDLILGPVAVLLVLEASRRLIGIAMPLVAVIFLAYIYFGRYIPIDLGGHAGFSYKRAVNIIYLSNEGIFGLPLGVSATFVILFIIFGSVFQESGAGQFIIELAHALFGRVRGGPGKIAVVSSSLFGTISGSAVANVVVDGYLTIPMMKGTGFRPHVAAAIEAAASTGGQLMPPVMGAAAFVMSEYLNIPYFEIALAAALPAILYYIALFLMVDLEAAKMGMKGLPSAQLPSLGAVLARGIHLAVPIVFLIYALGQLKWTPMKGAFWTIVIAIAISWLRPHTRMTPRKILLALERGAVGSLDVAAACACAGIIVGVVFLTGLGLRISNMLVDLSGGNLLVLLVLTMVTSLILGMGLPTTACYIILAILVAPGLVKMGALPLAAHLFVFYFGIIAVVTPPVALAAYAAAAIGECDPMRTGYAAWRLALSGFIIPYMFVYGPALILRGTPQEVIVAFVSATVGVCALSVAVQGHLLGKVGWALRIMFFLGALGLIHTGLETDLVGYSLVGIAVAIHVWSFRRPRQRAMSLPK